MRKAFTLIEVVVSLGILAVILSFAGTIFRVSIDSQRMAMANAEIMQKLRVITEQLDADFRGLCKDGEILVFWKAARKPATTQEMWNDPSSFERFDTIMFFATGDFYTYGADPQRSNVARICYTLACVPSTGSTGPIRPAAQKPETRMLVRTQHILTPPTSTNVNDPLGMGSFSDADWRDWNSNRQAGMTPAHKRQVDAVSMQGWSLMSNPIKADVLSIVGDARVGFPAESEKYRMIGGVVLDRAQPADMHPLLCDGVGEFKVQGWSRDPNDDDPRWIPEVNPNRDGSLTDSDFFLNGADLHTELIPGLWYPNGPLILADGRNGPFRRADNSPIFLTDMPLRDVPGLGRALKFTFALYDSRGLIRNGRTFTHIVTLDE